MGEDGGDLEIREEEDVYNIVNEEEYQTLVNSRRQRKDFLVDDGKSPISCRIWSNCKNYANTLAIHFQDGLVYYDDGEERLGDEDAEQERRKRSRTAALTAIALKKDRKNKSSAR